MIDALPTEHQECVDFASWLKIQGLTFTKTTQETYTRSWKQKFKNKAEGLMPGLPDYIIVLKDNLLFVEMKRQKGGATSSYQKHWIEELQKIQGVQAKVCKGADEAIAFVEQFL